MSSANLERIAVPGPTECSRFQGLRHFRRGTFRRATVGGGRRLFWVCVALAVAAGCRDGSADDDGSGTGPRGDGGSDGRHRTWEDELRTADGRAGVDSPSASADAGGSSDAAPGGGPVIPPGSPPFADVPSWRPSQAPGLVATAQPVLACTGAAEAAASVLCVRHDSAAEGEDGTAERPFRSVRGAVDAAKDGDVIQVAAGTYKEHVELDERSLTLQGGFAPGFGERVPATHITTLEGPGNDAVVSVFGGSVELSGFRITGGTGSGALAETYVGGGVYASRATLVIAQNVLERNDITGRGFASATLGSAIYAESCDVVIRGNVVSDNTSGRGAVTTIDGKARIEDNAILSNLAVGDHGAGLYLTGPDITATGNLVARNRLVPRSGEGGWGGGITVYGDGRSSPRTRALLSRNVVTGNHAPAGGSGTFIDDGAEATLENELIYRNECPGSGAAGLYVDGLNSVRSSVQLVNCTIAAHGCGAAGTAIYVENSNVTVRDSILWDNGEQAVFVDPNASFSASYSIGQQPLNGRANMVSDPAFAATPLDFHLKSRAGRFDPRAEANRGAWVRDDVHSPAIDAADPSDSVGGESAPNGGRRDLGAYGGTVESSLSL